MTPYLPRTVALVGLLTAGGLLVGTYEVVSAPPGERPFKPAGNDKPAPAMVFIVGTGNFKSDLLDKLPKTVGYAAELATEFYALKYQVRFATDQQSAPAARKQLGKAIAVEEINDGAALTREIELWAKDVLASQPPLAFLVLTGHGEERLEPADNDTGEKNVAYYLCRDDAPGKDGVSLEGVKNAAAQLPGAPLVIVYNACRTPAKGEKAGPKDPKVPKGAGDPQPVTPVSPGRPLGSGTLRIRASERAPSGLEYPTILYATRSGAPAFANEDLIYWLAKGLRYDDDTRQFMRFFHPELQRPQADLTLYHWVYFATAGQLRAQRLRQPHELVYGAVPGDAVVREVTDGTPRAPRARHRVVDLLDAFRPTAGKLAGGFPAAFDARTGLTITKPSDGLAADWALGKFAGSAEYSVANKILLLDVVAGLEGTGRVAPSLAFEIHPKNVGVKKEEFLSECAYEYRVLGRQMTRIAIPLQSVPSPAGTALPMNQLGFTEPRNRTGWPVGAALTITGMKLVPQPPGDPLRAIAVNPTQVNLLQAWHHSDPDPTTPLVIDVDRTGKSSFPWQLLPIAGAAGPSRCGGALVSDPLVYVPKGSVLEVEGTNTGRKEGVFSIELAAGGGEARTPFTAARPIKIPAGATVKATVKCVESGYADYLALSTADTGIRLKRAAIRPATATELK